VATWLDELLGHVASRLEHPAQAFTEFTSDKIVSLHTCALYTVAKLESGTLYWWLVYIFSLILCTGVSDLPYHSLMEISEAIRRRILNIEAAIVFK
jgi:hypothetical protein